MGREFSDQRLHDLSLFSYFSESHCDGPRKVEEVGVDVSWEWRGRRIMVGRANAQGDRGKIEFDPGGKREVNEHARAVSLLRLSRDARKGDAELPALNHDVIETDPSADERMHRAGET